MVKLIVTDMDNTLLLNDKRLPTGTVPLIRKLRSFGIHFAVGSARTWSNLSAIFAPVADSMGFICDNGAYGELDGAPFVKEVLQPQEIRDILDFCETIPGINLILCGRDAVYYEPPHPFGEHAPSSDSTDSLYKMVEVPDLRALDVDIFRVGIHDPKNPLYHSYPLLREHFGETYGILVTDDESVDLMKPGIDKGTGLMALQQALGVTPEETMVFGDYLNDIGMLKRAYYSYAMENALDEVKAQCRFLARSNQEEGVLAAIEEYLASLPEGPDR